MRVAPFGSKRCRGFPSRKHEHDDSLQVASMKSVKNLSVESLPIRRHQPSTPATVLEELPARLVVHFERHWIRDTNHTAAAQQHASSRQDSRNAEATILNSSSTRDLQHRGDDESTSEHTHVQLAKQYLRFLEQEVQQKRWERRTTNGQLPTRKCEAVEDGDHEQNQSPIFESWQLDTLSLLPACPFFHTCS